MVLFPYYKALEMDPSVYKALQAPWLCSDEEHP